jgi:cation diffusion facilitator CzcD-associated flavoprotein CzcO
VTERVHGVVLVGDGNAATELLAAGINDFVIFDREVTSAVFDDATDTWTLTADGGEFCRGRVVITCESPFIPWIPDLFGRRDFRGPAIHASMPETDFDPAGRRVAVIGPDASAGELIDLMARPAAGVKVFPLSPRRIVPRLRRTVRFIHRRRIQVITSPIDEVTAAGVRTADGVHHDADAVVYGTGFAVRAGLPHDTLVGARGVSIHQAWVDGAEPYLGMALHGFPNYFTVSGPDSGTAMRYVVECLQLMGRHSRIEVRRSAQSVFNERVHLRRPSLRLDATAFDLSSFGGADEQTYEGPATLTIADTCAQVRVRLAGHVDPIDGQYHWQGTIFDEMLTDLLTKSRTVDLAVGDLSSSARITEKTPQGTHSIAGVGAPPFHLPAVELAAPQG